VLAVALIGAIAGRFRARGMARAMTGAAIVQALVGGVAVVAAGHEPPGVVGQVVLNGIFVLLFAGAALLFAHAGVVSTRRPVDR
jgi:heme A synthase